MATPIASPVYTLGAWMGNVEDDWGTEWLVENEDGWSSSPPVRPVAEDRAHADGAWGAPGLYGARVISLSGRAFARTRVEMLAAKDRIKAAVNPRDLLPLIVEEAHLTRCATVRLSGQVELQDVSANMFSFGLTVTATDPRRYGVDRITQSTLLPIGIGVGRTYNRTFDYTYGGGGGESGAIFIDQIGDYDQTPAVITIVGPVIDPRVEHVQTGRYLAFTLTVEWGEELVIDLAAQTALLGGHANRAHTLTPGSAWFHLVPGENEILFRGSPGTTPDGSPPEPQMTVTAAPAWT